MSVALCLPNHIKITRECRYVLYKALPGLYLRNCFVLYATTSVTGEDHGLRIRREAPHGGKAAECYAAAPAVVKIERKGAWKATQTHDAWVCFRSVLPSAPTPTGSRTEISCEGRAYEQTTIGAERVLKRGRYTRSRIHDIETRHIRCSHRT